MNTNNGWLDIASAPKDGTPVLLFARHIDAEARTRVVGWFNTDYGWIAQSYVGQPIVRLIPSQWAELLPFPGTPPASAQDAITVSLDPDPRGVSVGVWQGSRCIYNGAHPLPASAQDDAKDEKQAFEAWHKREFGSYVPEVTNHYNRWLGWEGCASVAAPAAGDALDAQRWRFIRRKLCLTGNGDGTCAIHAINLPASVPGWPEPGPAVAEFCDAAIDAEISSQQGEGGAA